MYTVVYCSVDLHVEYRFFRDYIFETARILTHIYPVYFSILISWTSPILI